MENPATHKWQDRHNETDYPKIDYHQGLDEEEQVLPDLWDLAPEECFMDEEDGLPDLYWGGLECQ